MSTFKKIVQSTALVAACATMSFGHLPSVYDASLRMGKIGVDGKGRATYTNKGAWSASTAYKGDYTIAQGDTVSHGTFNNKTLWWWAKFSAEGAEMTPGQFAPQGGTSPWVLINSLSAASNNGKVNYTWRGWNGDMANMTGLKAEIPTWRDGAVGAYSFTHDDIGAMPFDKSVQPGWNVGKDFPDIKQCWGVYVEKMTESSWAGAREMVKQGHEMFNHSMRHTSAADQWQWFWPDSLVPTHDPAIPKSLRGLKVVGIWNEKVNGIDFNLSNKTATDMDITKFATKPSGTINTSATSNQGNAQVPLTLGASTNEWTNEGDPKAVFYNDYLEIECSVDWTGLSPTEAFVSSDPAQVKAGITKITVKDPSVTIITLPSGQKQYVKYTKPVDTLSEEPIQEGFLIATGIGWYDLGPLTNEYSNWYNGHYLANTWDPTANGGAGANTAPGGQVSALDKGRSGFLAKIFAVKAWAGADFKDNIKDANDTINKHIYSQLNGDHISHFFRKGKTSEYFGYPFDAYSEVTHDSLEQNGFVGARGGAKSGKPIPGDFFHPYRIDFDAFFIEESDWTVASTGGKFIYPENPHVLLGLNEMVDKIITSKGYMIREFHAVADIAASAWYDNSIPANEWPINSSGKGVGGWWGGITADQLRAHYQYVQGKIDSRDLAVYTVGEVTKYRMTANATSAAAIVADGNDYKLTCTTSETIAEKYREEISVIVNLTSAVDSLGAEYTTPDAAWGDTPRRRPVKMDGTGTRWSVSIQPYLGELKLIANGAWTPITTATATKARALQFAGLRGGNVALSLPAGAYTAQLFNAAGRMVNTVNINSQGGVVSTGLSTNSLGSGLYILNVKQAGATVLQHKLMVR